ILKVRGPQQQSVVAVTCGPAKAGQQRLLFSRKKACPASTRAGATVGSTACVVLGTPSAGIEERCLSSASGDGSAICSCFSVASEALTSWASPTGSRALTSKPSGGSRPTGSQAQGDPCGCCG